MEQEIVGKEFLEKFGQDMYKTLIERRVFDDSDDIEIRLPCYRSLDLGIYLVTAIALKFFILWIKGDLNNFKSSF